MRVRVFEFQENFSLNGSSQKKNDPITITESLFSDNKEKVTVTIEAIHALTTGNYNTYTAKELMGSAEKNTGVHSWTYPYNKPVLTHHNTRSGEPIGRVIKAEYREISTAGPPAIVLTAEITDKDAVEKIKDGRYHTVSVGGRAEHAHCSICNTDWMTDGWCEHWPGEKYDGKTATLILKDITFLEVSFVNTPADSYARIIDSKDDNQNGSVPSYEARNGRVIKEGQQGGKKMDVDVKDLQEQLENLKEKNKTKENMVKLLEEKLEKVEKERDSAFAERDSIVEENKSLKLELEKLKDELEQLAQENAGLRAEQHKILAEKVVNKKIELGKLDKEEFEEALESHIKRTEESLKDSLADLEEEAKRLEEKADEGDDVTVPGDPLQKEGLHNSNDDSKVITVNTVEGDNDGGINLDDISKALKSLI